MKIVLISTDESFSAVGIKTLSACLLERGFQTVIVIMSSKKLNYGEICWEDLDALCEGAGLIGLSCMTHAVHKAVEVKRHLDEKFKVPVIIGGIHATSSPEELLKDFDLVCYGEGEDLIVELAERLKNHRSYQDIPGLWSRTGGEVIRSHNQPLKRALSDYPFPDYDLKHQFILEADRLVPVRPIDAHMYLEEFSVLGSRGCPHHCAYCINHKLNENFPWRKKVRFYPIDYLIEHLKTIRRAYPEVREFCIEDDTFFANKIEDVRKFGERYKNEVGRPFKMHVSPTTFSEDKLRLLIDAGMDRLILGIQSGSENTNFNMYQRKMPNQKTYAVAKALQPYADKVTLYYDFIGMNPFEGEEDLLDTIRFMRSLPHPFWIYFNCLAFYPESEMYRKAVKAGLDVRRLSIRDKIHAEHLAVAIIRTENIPNKLLHYIQFLMEGGGDSLFVGLMPRALLSDPCLSSYRFLNRMPKPAVNALLFVLTAGLPLYARLVRWIKKLNGPKARTILRKYLLLFKSGETRSV